MEYVYWVIPGLLAGRPGPDEVSWDLQELQSAGFGAILSLHDGGQDLEAIRHAGFIQATLPLPASVPPAREGIAVYEESVPRALSFIKKHVLRGIPTLVHCHAGRNRACLVMVCYLCLVEGIDWARAVKRLRKVKPEALAAGGYETLSKHLVKELRQSVADCT